MFEKQSFTPQYSAPLVEQVAQFLTNAIIEGRLKHGQRLVENELGREFKISRASIREAFRILEKKGLVIIIPRKGTFIREVTRKDIEESFPVRANLEAFAASMAIENQKTETIRGIEVALSNMRDSANQGDFRSYVRYHFEYHEILIRACGNETLIGILENLRSQAFWFRFSYLYHKEKVDELLDVHQKILDLFIERDGPRLSAFVKEHIMEGRNKYLQFLESSQDDL